MEEAVDVIKQIASQPILLPENSHCSAQDTIDYFINYIGAKLREMSPQRRKLAENQILNILINT